MIPVNTAARHKPGALFLKLLLTIVFAFFAFLMILPFLWMISASFKVNGELFKYPIEWIPKKWNFDNYKQVWNGPNPFYLFYYNSIKITAITVVGNLLTSAMAGYAFAKIRFRGSGFLFLLYLSTMMIPGQVLLVPRFILFDRMGLINSHWAIILPGLFTIFGTFLMRQFFSTLPNELLEAAKVDGAGYWRTFWQICLPLTKPAIVTLLILSFTWHWNDYENPLIFLRDKDLFTIPIGLTTYVEEFGTNYTLTMAASVSGLVPVLIVVMICQKWFIEGIATTGVKG
ncbi:carbohydrate ABC transporter permease [Paenibacillus koleovorans]|uniref:carbohydrate ABC transporter permease n=1 Tax=Paenibacillus koleovorans TaxID=121608 RepID=UPI000FDB9D00|nr:carbohydrate ABC transporter permease [Paenibacillus koleovorans]